MMMMTMTKRLWMVLAVVANTWYVCLAQNAVVKMQPEKGATEVNIDTHLVLTMSDEATIGQKGFVSVYDKQTGKLVDRLDMSIPAGPTERRILRLNTRLYLMSISRSTSPTATPRLAHRLELTPGTQGAINSTSSAASLMASISIPSSPRGNK